MPKIKITGLPKFALGGPDDCPEGMVWDESLQTCVYDNGYQEQQKFQTNATLSTGTPKTGPGTGVNPAIKVEVEQKCPPGYVKNKKGECRPKAIVAAYDATRAGMTLFNAASQIKENKRVEDEFESSMRNNLFTGQVYAPGKQFRMGKTETASGVEFPSLMTPPNEGMFSNAFYGYQRTQFGGPLTNQQGIPAKAKIRILETPDALPEQMKYGGQSSYGLDLGWKIGYTDMSKTSSDHITNSVSEDKNAEEPYIMEAEGGETLYKPGDQTLSNIEGDKHSQGGVKLTSSQVNSENSDEPSFVFSDTKDLKIKDKNLLKYFGIKKFKRGGVTPAEISKKFDLNKFKAILEDPNKDDLSRTTAQMMLNKNEGYLAKLATVQEVLLKGEQPPEFTQEKLAKAKNGGRLDKFIPRFDNGGPGDGDPKNKLGQYSQDYATLEKLLKSDDNKALREEIYNRYKKANPNSSISEDDYINNLLEAQKQFYAINEAYKDKPDYLKSEEWDKVKHGKKNKRYKEVAEKLKFKPLTESQIRQFQQAYRDMEDAMRDPKFFQTFGRYFKTDPIGKNDQQYEGRPVSPVDDIAGNTTIGQLFRLAPIEEDPKIVIPPTEKPPEEKPKTPKWLCTIGFDGKPVVKQTTTGIGYDSYEEAAKYCGRPPQRPPFDYLLPDKVNMLAQAAIFPEMILPFAPDLAGAPGQLNLEDYRAPSAMAFSTQYAAPANMLAQYTGPQGLSANFSSLAGQAAQNITGQIMPGVTSRNIDRANQFGQQELARQDAINQFNLAQKMKRYEGWAVARQQYQNSLRKYLKDNSDAFTRAWNNRMMLGDINDSNTNFFKSPLSGRNYFYNPNTMGIAGLPSSPAGSKDDADYATTYKEEWDKFSYLGNNARARAAEKATAKRLGIGSSYGSGSKKKKSKTPYDYTSTNPFIFQSTGSEEEEEVDNQPS